MIDFIRVRVVGAVESEGQRGNDREGAHYPERCIGHYSFHYSPFKDQPTALFLFIASNHPTSRGGRIV